MNGEGGAGRASAVRSPVHMIVAHGKNRVIGRDGDMPWRLRDDLRFFKETTSGHTVVMGRKTFESIGRPLPNRTNVVITRNSDFQPKGVIVARSPEAALAAGDVLGSDDAVRLDGGDRSADGPRLGDDARSEPIFVIGGGQIYEALLPLAEVVYVTVVDAEPEGDTRFPELGPAWRWTELRRHKADEHNDYDFVIYRVERRHPTALDGLNP